VALIRDYFETGYYPSGFPKSSDSFNPSSSLVKAVLINGDIAMESLQSSQTSNSALSNPPDNIQGFGLVRLRDSLNTANDFSLIVFDSMPIEEDQYFTQKITIISNAKPVRITLVWTDPPPTPGSVQILVNDLDVIAKLDGSDNLYYPNGLTSRDTLNNVERIEIPASDLQAGQVYIIQVYGKSLSSFYPVQNFSLVVSGVFSNEALNSSDPVDLISSSGFPVQWAPMLYYLLAVCISLVLLLF
jgi:hypothetical protein